MLVGFQQSDVDAGESGARAVEGVAKAIFAFGVLESETKAASLEVFEVGATGDFEVGVLAWGPDFDVVSLGAAEAEVAGTKLDHAVMQAKGLKDFLGVGSQRLELGVGRLGGRQFDEFNFVELMDANEAAGAEAGGPGFAPEARGISDEFFREVGEGKDFLAMEIGDGDFGSGGEVELVAFATIELLLELGQLAGADEGFLANDEGGAELRVPMLASMEVEHVVDERALEAGALAGVAGKGAAAHAGGAFEIEQAEVRADIDMAARRG